MKKRSVIIESRKGVSKSTPPKFQRAGFIHFWNVFLVPSSKMCIWPSSNMCVRFFHFQNFFLVPCLQILITTNLLHITYRDALHPKFSKPVPWNHEPEGDLMLSCKTFAKPQHQSYQIQQSFHSYHGSKLEPLCPHPSSNISAICSQVWCGIHLLLSPSQYASAQGMTLCSLRSGH